MRKLKVQERLGVTGAHGVTPVQEQASVEYKQWLRNQKVWEMTQRWMMCDSSAVTNVCRHSPSLWTYIEGIYTIIPKDLFLVDIFDDPGGEQCLLFYSKISHRCLTGVKCGEYKGT